MNMQAFFEDSNGSFMRQVQLAQDTINPINFQWYSLRLDHLSYSAEIKPGFCEKLEHMVCY